MKKLLFATLFLALTIALPVVHAQTGSAPQVASSDAKIPSYDVVVIKPNKSGTGSSRISSNMNLYNATNVSLKILLQDAYDLNEDLIAGIPDSIESARFDIQAKVVDTDPDVLKKLDTEQRRAMRRAILVDRFQLKAHIERKTLPVYEMVVIKGGPKFKTSSNNGNSGYSIHTHNIQNGTELVARNISMASFASALYAQVHRTVSDKTGFASKYDLDLKWSADDSADPGSDSGPSIFTALQEQLGLKLRSAKGPVETLVVDHAEMPSAN
jgi:uncharacterized protein (TIGR03435 family)